MQAGHVAEFRGAYGSKVFRVREQDRPTVSDPLVEIDWTLRSFGGEIRRFVVYAQGHSVPPYSGYTLW
jgi:hypothetical protein